jgi:hypothetical protein
MNALSDIGRQKIAEELLDENGDLSIPKLSKMLLDDLSTQDADDNLLEGV